jgi:hypothetical protein
MKLMATGRKPLSTKIIKFLAKHVYNMKSYPNRRMKPYSSIHMPTRGHPKKTTTMPEKNAADPLILCLWKKKKNVLSSPIKKASPERNRSCKMENTINIK